MNPQQLALLSNVGSDVVGNALMWNGGWAAFEVLGTLDGVTVTLQTLGADGQTWGAYSAATTVTADGVVEPVYLPAGPVRAAVTGGSGESGIYATLTAILN